MYFIQLYLYKHWHWMEMNMSFINPISFTWFHSRGQPKTRSPGKSTWYLPYKTIELITKPVKFEITTVLVAGRWQTETHIC